MSTTGISIMYTNRVQIINLFLHIFDPVHLFDLFFNFLYLSFHLFNLARELVIVRFQDSNRITHLGWVFYLVLKRVK